MPLMDTYFFELAEHAKQFGKDKSILLMQVGSFYEAYQTLDQGFDLNIISELTNFIVTRKDKSVKEISINNPYTLGFPLNSLNKNVAILTDAGYQVKVIDQNTTNRKSGNRIFSNKATGKMERHVKGIYSSGTLIDLELKDNNYILSLWLEKSDPEHNSTNIFGITIADISTGEWEINDYVCDKDDKYQSMDEICRYINTYQPVEIVLSGDDIKLWSKDLIKYLEIEERNYYIFDSKDKLYKKLVYQNKILSEIFNQKNSIEYLDIENYHYGRLSLMVLLDYIDLHNSELKKNLKNIRNYVDNKYLYLGNNALNQLHVLSSEGYQQKVGNKFKSLFDVINFTSTAMGKRKLKRELSHPLTICKEIKERYEIIEKMGEIKYDLKEDLQYISDMEKMQQKLQIGELHPFELYKWIVSYQRIINLEKKVGKVYPIKLKDIENVYNKINKIFDSEKLSKYSNGNIRDNIFIPKVNEELDKIQKKLDENREILIEVAKYVENFENKKEEEEIKKKKLPFIKKAQCKVEFNERDGHHLITTKKRWKSIETEIKNNNIVINSINIECKKFEGKDNSVSGTKIFSEQLRGFSDNIIKYEAELCEKVQEEYENYCIDFANKYKNEINQIINWISDVDFFYSGVQCIKKYRYKLPEVIDDKNKKSWLITENIRHPIVERLSENYIPFDLKLGSIPESADPESKNKDTYNGMLLFGLNSAGKSTLQKSVGLNLILAQMGYPVACTKFKYSPYTSLFTRISGNDNIFKGLSSFTVEMLEIRNILKRTNERSLIIADEVCRGTEYESGLIIVLTMIKLLSEKNCNFITATHLHEIVNSEIYKNLEKVKSFHIKISYDEKSNILIYDRELKEGSGENFYGLLVAKCLIDDRDFVQYSTDIKKEIIKTEVDTSKYNKNIIKDACQICEKTIKNGNVPLETHHIVFQKDADKDGYINEYKHKNNSNNLMVLCSKCHDEIDRGNIVVKGKTETSKGEQVVYQETNETNKQDEKIELIESYSNDSATESEIDELIESDNEDNKLKKRVLELSKKKLSQKLIKEKLSKENIKISIAKISQIIKGI